MSEFRFSTDFINWTSEIYNAMCVVIRLEVQEMEPLDREGLYSISVGPKNGKQYNIDCIVNPIAGPIVNKIAADFLASEKRYDQELQFYVDLAREAFVDVCRSWIFTFLERQGFPR